MGCTRAYRRKRVLIWAALLFLLGLAGVGCRVSRPDQATVADSIESPFSPDHIEQVTELTRLGKGRLHNVAYAPDGQLVAVASSVGVFLYDAETLALMRELETSAPVWSVTFSPNGSVVAAGMSDGSLLLLLASDFTRLQTLTGHASGVHAVAFSPDGSLLASGSSDRTVRLWHQTAFDGASEARWDPQLSIAGHSLTVTAVAFSPDGALLASASADQTVRLWRVAACDGQTTQCGDPVDILEGHAFRVNSVSFAPLAANGGMLLASAAEDQTVRLWQVGACASAHPSTFAGKAESVGCATLAQVLEGHGAELQSVAFAPVMHTQRALLAAGDWDGAIRLWKVSACAPLGETETRAALGNKNQECATHLKGLTAHKNKVLSIAFAPDGTQMISAGQDSELRRWDVTDCLPHRAGANATSNTCGKPSGTLRGHLPGINSLQFSPTGQLLASGSEGAAARLWRVTDGTLVHTLADHLGPVDSVFFSPDGKTLATGDSKRLTSGTFDDTVRLWQVSDGVMLDALPGQKEDVGVCAVYYHRLAFSPDGTLLASGSHNNRLRLWRVSDRKLLRELAGHTGALLSVAFNPDGTLLATAAWGDDTVRLWPVSVCAETPEECGAHPTALPGHATTIMSLAFSPDGRLLVAGLADGALRLWQTSDKTAIATIPGDAGAVLSVVFAPGPDGDILAAGSLDGTLRIWQLSGCTGASKRCGVLLRTLHGHTGRVNGVAFSPDGRLLASGSEDGTVRIWGISEIHIPQ